MNVETELLDLRRRVRRLRAGALAVVLTGFGAVACGAYYAKPSTSPDGEHENPTFKELTVERLNVREPDGTLRMVVSNASLAPDPVVDGKSTPGRKGGNEAGVIFYDGNGNESGGLLSGGTKRDGAGSWFAFDRHDQDQTLAMGYNEGKDGQYESGVYVWDRPEATLGELLPKYHRLRELPPGPERDALARQMQDAGEFERFRAFFGREGDGTALVSLADAHARTRLKLMVGPDGEPRIEFLNTDGSVKRSITADGSANGG